MLSAGQLNERVTFQQRVGVKDAVGGETVSWSDVATVWANVRQPSSRELFAAAQMQSALDHVVTIRYRTDINSAMRVMWRGKALDIVGDPADFEGRRRELVIKCVAGLRNG